MQLKQILKLCVLALIGGITYMLIELAWRGYSHISMFILGPFVFCCSVVSMNFCRGNLGLFADVNWGWYCYYTRIDFRYCCKCMA